MGALDGRVALITGAGGGQGLAAARLFAAEGARVVVNDLEGDRVRAAVEEIRGAGGEAVEAVGDVSDAEDVRRALATATDAFGRLDVLYNNAGIGYSAKKRFGVDMSDTLSCSEADWERILAVNAKGVFLMCKHGIPLLIEGGGGSVINTASIGAIRGAANAHAYMASKGAVVALTRALAVTYGPQNVRANVLLPGIIDTEMIRDELIANTEIRDALASSTPLRRNGTAEDVARAALFLATPGSEFVTGQEIVVDGGISVGV